MANLTIGNNAVKDGGGTLISGGVETFTDPNRSNAQGAVVAVVLNDGTILALGQALAAASLPVVLPAAQITSLTAPVLAAGTAIVGKVTTDQTTHGTTDLVAADLTKVAGTAIVTGGVAGTQGVGGDTAAAATDAGNPVKIGGLGKTTNPTAVTDGQRVAALFDKLGKQVVVGAVRDLKAVQKTTISNTTETTIVTAAGAGVFADLYGLVISNTSATGVSVTIKDATGGTTRMIVYVPATDVRGFTLPVSSAVVQAAANNNWTATASGSVSSLEITALYVKNL